MTEDKKIYEIGVQHLHAGKVYTFITEDGDLKPGDKVLVEEENGGSTLVEVVSKPKETEETESRKKILKKANLDDLIKDEDYADRAEDHLKFCRDRVRERDLPMKMVGARYCDNGKKLIFFFTSEGRVDFRALVRELAQTLKLRIELRQIGSRDGTKYIGCLGPCGQTTCCSTHLRQFQSISVGMAKNQNLSPNPTKLTGMCNKLKCCLAYENQLYSEVRSRLPKVNSYVRCEHGDGKIIDIRIPTEEIYVRVQGEMDKWVRVVDAKPISEDEVKKYNKDREDEAEEKASKDRRTANKDKRQQKPKGNKGKRDSKQNTNKKNTKDNEPRGKK